MHRLHHWRQRHHAVARVDQGHARRCASLVEDAGVALDDETDAVAGVLHEVLRVDLGRVGARPRALQDRRAVQPVPHDGAADGQRRREHCHAYTAKNSIGWGVPRKQMLTKANAKFRPPLFESVSANSKKGKIGDCLG